MLHITIVTVGKRNVSQLDELITTYLQRLRQHAKLGWSFVPSSSIGEESRQVLRCCSDDAYVVLLDETGTLVRSVDIAESVEMAQNNSVKHFVIIIGGAFGVNQAVRDRANAVWSLGRITLPHQIVRLVITEQLYRAYDILAEGPYHHY